jgi:hypothetical protein
MDNIKNLIAILKGAGDVAFISDDATIEIAGDNNIEASIKKLGFDAEVVQRKVRISSYQTTLVIFIDINDFRNRVKQSDFNNKAILILGKSSPVYYYEKENTYIDFEISNTDFSVSNGDWYFRLLGFLKTQEHKEDNVFYFIDHFNSDSRNIIFTSLKKEGKLSIPYPSTLPLLEKRFNLKKRVQRLIDCFASQNKHLPKFIKAELFNFLAKEERANRMHIFLQKLDEIIDAAEQNHEIYLSDLSLEHLKREYFDHREKYFQQAREILGKVTTQIVALPLSITASAFAVYRVDNAPEIQVLICLVFVIYSCYMVFIIKIYKQDIFEIKAQSESDLTKIKKSNFFTTYPMELTEFEKIADRVEKKIDTLWSVVQIYYFTLLGSNSLFILFALRQLEIGLIFAGILAGIFFLTTLSLWFFPKNKMA